MIVSVARKQAPLTPALSLYHIWAGSVRKWEMSRGEDQFCRNCMGLFLSLCMEVVSTIYNPPAESVDR
jgi:hypothetical protein